MLDLFHKPINIESLDSWAKNLDEIARIAILAMPVVIYGSDVTSFKAMNIVFLIFSCYFSVYLANLLRNKKKSLLEIKE